MKRAYRLPRTCRRESGRRFRRSIFGGSGRCPYPFGGVEEDLRSFDVSLYERLRTLDRAVDVRLCREVDDGVDVGDEIADELFVAYVPFDELMSWMVEHTCGILGRPRVRECVECNDRAISFVDEIVDEVRADESCTTSDEYAHIVKETSRAYLGFFSSL